VFQLPSLPRKLSGPVVTKAQNLRPGPRARHSHRFEPRSQGRKRHACHSGRELLVRAPLDVPREFYRLFDSLAEAVVGGRSSERDSSCAVRTSENLE